MPIASTRHMRSLILLLTVVCLAPAVVAPIQAPGPSGRRWQGSGQESPCVVWERTDGSSLQRHVRAGRTLWVALSAGGLVTSVAESGGPTVSYVRDGAGAIVAVNCESGQWRIAYAGQDIVSVAGPDGTLEASGRRLVWRGLALLLQDDEGRPLAELVPDPLLVDGQPLALPLKFGLRP